MITRLRWSARELVTGGRGLLAVDESVRTMSAWLATAGAEASAHNRRAFREMLITTPGLSRGVSGVILSAETFGQRLDNGTPFPQAVAELGMMPGIRVDTGIQPLAGAPGETVTEGLDNLRERLHRYAARGARFATWRALISVGDQRPSERALRANAHALARYSALCQETGVVPVVELDLCGAGAHTIHKSADATSVTMLMVMRELHDAGVEPSAVVLAPSMVTPAGPAGHCVAPEEVAERTVRALSLVVSPDIAGVAFLSGGQRLTRATESLAALQRQDSPWPLTFSFGAVLTEPALTAWRGNPARVQAGQQALATRVACSTAAVRGESVVAPIPAGVVRGDRSTRYRG